MRSAECGVRNKSDESDGSDESDALNHQLSTINQLLIIAFAGFEFLVLSPR